MRKLFIYFIVITLLFSGCQKFDEFQKDPNRTTSATPGLLLTNIEVSAFNSISLDAALASRYLVNINLVSEYQYYNWNQGSFGNYSLLRQVIKMEEVALDSDEPNYLAIAKFFRAFLYDEMSKQFGDIPYFDALKAPEGLYKPEYDSQEDIYKDILRLLREASQEISSLDGPIVGDVVYNGDHEKWKKLINSYRLRLLISLSKKTGNSNFNVEQEFREIFENPDDYPIFTSNADNCGYPFSFESGNLYPFYQKAYILTAHIMEESFLERLKNLQDPRLFVLADQDEKSSGQDELDWDTYTGFRASDPIDVNTTRLGNGEGSPIDYRYIDDPEAEMNLVYSYAELCFTLAEAAQRGWIAADAAAYYREGISASMGFYGIALPDIMDYLNNPLVVFDPLKGLEMILTQKHTAMFLNSGWESYYNQRRTGFPEFDISGAGMLNNGQIPKRWMYPTGEIELNLENLTQAIDKQYNSDNINETMWLLIEE
jgi:hypothetical protein